MRKCTILALGSSALGVSCANDFSERIFAAIDKQHEGFRTVNKEVSRSGSPPKMPDMITYRVTDLGESRARIPGDSCS